MKRFVLASSLAALASCASAPPAPTSPGLPAKVVQGAPRPIALQEVPLAGDPASPAPADLTVLPHKRLWSTAYLVWPATEDTTNKAIPLTGSNGSSLGISVSQKDWCNAAMEGTVAIAIKDGSQRTFNYTGLGAKPATSCRRFFSKSPPKKIEALDKTLFREVPKSAPYGTGAIFQCGAEKEQLRLVPYRSIAVDAASPNSVPVGTVLFIPNLRGKVRLDDGTMIDHDGYVFAADSGGLVKGDHIDFFKGRTTNDHVPVNLRSSPKDLFDAYIVADAAISEHMCRLHSQR